jgi:hypothetical protein
VAWSKAKVSYIKIEALCVHGFRRLSRLIADSILSHFPSPVMSNPSTQLEKQIDKIVPEDIINTLQSGYKVFSGEADQLDDFLKHGGQLIRKASQRFTPTQLIIGIAVLASIAVFAAAKAAESDTDEPSKA